MNRNQRRRQQILHIKDDTGISIKTALIALDFFLFLLSIGVFGFGVWLGVWTYGFNTISIIMNNDIYKAAYILLIISGILMAMVAFIGLVGSQQESSYCTLVFLCAVVISALMLLTAAALGMVFNNTLKNEINTNLTSAINNNYGINLQVTRNKEITTAIDDMQKLFKCCGVAGVRNSTTSWYTYRTSAWFLLQKSQAPFVPDSCCVLNSAGTPENSNYCQGKQLIPSGETVAPIKLATTANPYLNENGCISTMTESVNYFSLAIFGLALGTLLYLVILIVLTCCLLRYIEVGKYEADLERKEVEKKKTELAYQKNNRASTSITRPSISEVTDLPEEENSNATNI